MVKVIIVNKLTVQILDISIVWKMFQKMIADQFSRQILDLDKFWTNFGQITMSFSGSPLKDALLALRI